MAILLHEEGYLDRARLYATDINKQALDIAESAIYPALLLPDYARNYREAGGEREFEDYFSGGYAFAKLKGFLKDRITFAFHNLVTDGVFGEMNLVCCRNVLIYFDRPLQERVLSLMSESLRHGGLLCLGNKETLAFSSVRSLFEPVDAKQSVYRKCR